MHQHGDSLHAPFLRVPLVHALPLAPDGGRRFISSGQGGGAAPQAGVRHQDSQHVPQPQGHHDRPEFRKVRHTCTNITGVAG